MSISLAMIILAEFALTVFIVWGFFHEDRFVRFEHRIGMKIKRAFRRKNARPLRAIAGGRQTPRTGSTAA